MTLKTKHIVPENTNLSSVLVLLAEARAALPAEFCGTANSLAGRIDDVLRGPVLTAPELVLTRLPSGEFAWLRP